MSYFMKNNPGIITEILIPQSQKDLKEIVSNTITSWINEGIVIARVNGVAITHRENSAGYKVENIVELELAVQPYIDKLEKENEELKKQISAIKELFKDK